MANISLVIDKKQIIDGIKRSTKSSINSALHLASFDIKSQLIKLSDNLLKQSPEYRSLTGGRLKEELGIDNAGPVLDKISDIIKSSVDVSVVPVSNTTDSLSGGLNINMLQSGLQDILNIPGGSYKRGDLEIKWLQWLLTQGDRVILYNTRYELSPANSTRPKGVGVLEKGGGWRIPAEFSGFENDNWITRTFNIPKMQVEINRIVQESLKNRLK